MSWWPWSKTQSQRDEEWMKQGRRGAGPIKVKIETDPRKRMDKPLPDEVQEKLDKMRHFGMLMQGDRGLVVKAGEL